MRPLLLLHGFTQTHRAWDGVLAAGAGRGREVLAPDLPGHGARSDERPVAFADGLAGLVPPPGPPVVLCGYSLGGRLALLLALGHPGRVGRLVLVGASPGIADPVERDARRTADEELAERIERIGLERFAREWARGPLFRHQAPEVAEAAHADRLRNTAPGLAGALRGLGTGVMEPLWARLEELRMPVVLIVGERDGRYVRINRRMAELIPRAELLEVPGAGHAVALEAPAVVAAALGPASR